MRTAARVLLIATMALLPATAFSQGGGSGSVVGAVFDQTGQPMPGVKVIARSPTQIGGERVVYTNADGQFRFVGLIPGVFDVTTSAPKMATVHQKGISVGVNAPAEVNLVMEVQTRTEEVKVIERAPIVSTKSAVVKEQFDGEFLDSIPSDFKAGAEAVIANSTPGGVQVSSRTARMRGGSANHTFFQVEGFAMNGQRSTLKGMSAVEVQTAGYGAEQATVPGAVINMVTKSGSNKHEIDFGAYAEDNNLRFFQDGLDPKGRSYFYVINPNVSGPIIKDKLWYSVNVEARPELEEDGPDPLGLAPSNPTYHYLSIRGSAKLTWQLSPRNKLVSYTNGNTRSNYNLKRGYGPPLQELEAQHRQDERDFFQGFIWESLLTDRLFFKSQFGMQRLNVRVSPQMCVDEPGLCEHIAPELQNVPRQVYSKNYFARSDTVTRKAQFINTLEAFVDSKIFGEHDIRLKNDFHYESVGVASTVPGGRIVHYQGLQPSQQVETFSNDPRTDGEARYGYFIRTTNVWRNSTALSDAFKVTRRLTLTPGVALTFAQGGNNLPSPPTPPAGSVAITPETHKAFAVTPHLAIAWDATGDGRTAIRGSFNQYVDVDLTPLARHTVGGPVTRTCPWDPATNAPSANCTYGGGLSGRTVGLPCSPTGYDAQGNSCVKKLKTPRTTEYTVGVEREVVPGIALGGDLIYRKYANQYEQLETNRIWNDSGTDRVPVGAYRNGAAQTVLDIETPDGAKRTYRAGTISAHKREGALKINAGYTLAYLRGTVLDGINNPYGDIGPRDIYLDSFLVDDSRHNIRLTSTYAWTRWLTTGVLYDYKSGRPYLRRFFNTWTLAYEDYRARAGINPGTNLNDPSDDRESRLPDIQQLNIQVRVNWRPLIGIDLETYADVLNALALRTDKSVVQDDGRLWGTSVNDRLLPFRLRLGVNYRW
jgi:hypothetical protein